MVPLPSHSDYTLLALTVASLLAVGVLLALHMSLRARVSRLEAELREARKDIQFLRNQAMKHLRNGGQLSRILAEARGFFSLYAPQVLWAAQELDPDHCGWWPAARKDPAAVAEPGERRMVSVTRDDGEQ